MSEFTRNILIGLCVLLFIIMLWASRHVEGAPTPAKIEKVATVKLSTGGAIEVIGLNHRGHQCYLLVGQSQSNPVFTRAELICP